MLLRAPTVTERVEIRHVTLFHRYAIQSGVMMSRGEMPRAATKKALLRRGYMQYTYYRARSCARVSMRLCVLFTHVAVMLKVRRLLLMLPHTPLIRQDAADSEEEDG